MGVAKSMTLRGGGGGGGPTLSVTMTLIFPKIVWTCPLTELTIEEEDKEHLHLPLLVSSRCVSSEFPTRFCSKALQQ